MLNRTLIYAASMMLLLACVKVEQETHEPERISFDSPVVSTLTKAPIPGEIPEQVHGDKPGTYPEEESFSVFARHHTGDYQAWDTPGNVDYMTDVQTWFLEKVNGWDPENEALGKDPYFWPNGGKLTFAAYSPSDAKDDGTITYGKEGFVFADFTVDAQEVGQHKDVTYYDLMYSERTYNKTASVGGSSYSGVGLKFHHALSSVAFKVKLKEDLNAADADAEHQLNSVVLNRVSIRNAFKTATFRENITDGPEYVAAPAWSGYKDEMSLETEYYAAYDDMENGYTVAAANEAVEPSGSNRILLIPQPFDHGETQVIVRVNYTVTVNGTTTRQIVDVPLMTSNEGLPFRDQNGNPIESWEMGKRYVYTLEFGLYKIYFGPDIEVWNDTSVSGGGNVDQ